MDSGAQQRLNGLKCSSAQVKTAGTNVQKLAVESIKRRGTVGGGERRDLFYFVDRGRDNDAKCASSVTLTKRVRLVGRCMGAILPFLLPSVVDSDCGKKG